MICPKCNGRGTVGYYHIDHFVDIECDRCHGSGEVSEVEMTNEEWLKSLDTEELAKWLHTAIFDDNFANKIADKAYMNMQTRDDYIENWLMEKHE